MPRTVAVSKRSSASGTVKAPGCCIYSNRGTGFCELSWPRRSARLFKPVEESCNTENPRSSSFPAAVCEACMHPNACRSTVTADFRSPLDTPVARTRLGMSGSALWPQHAHVTKLFGFGKEILGGAPVAQPRSLFLSPVCNISGLSAVRGFPCWHSYCGLWVLRILAFPLAGQACERISSDQLFSPQSHPGPACGIRTLSSPVFTVSEDFSFSGAVPQYESVSVVIETFGRNSLRLRARFGRAMLSNSSSGPLSVRAAVCTQYLSYLVLSLFRVLEHVSTKKRHLPFFLQWCQLRRFLKPREGRPRSAQSRRWRQNLTRPDPW